MDALTQEKWAALMAAWHAGNDAGEGYGIGEPGQRPDEAAEDAGWMIVAHYVEGAILAQQPDGTHTMVCYAHGPWCVDVLLP